MSDLAETLSFQLRAAGIEHQREVMLVPGRRFRTDIFIAPDLAIECDGGAFPNRKGQVGRHARGAGIRQDCEKQCLLVVHGYRCMRVMTDQIRNGLALQWIEAAIRHG